MAIFALCFFLFLPVTLATTADNVCYHYDKDDQVISTLFRHTQIDKEYDSDGRVAYSPKTLHWKTSAFRSSSRSLEEITPTQEYSGDHLASALSFMVWEYLKDKVKGCQFAIITSNSQSPLVLHTIRYSQESLQPYVVVDVSKLHRMTRKDVLKYLVKGSVNCRGFLIDLTAFDNKGIFVFLEESNFWWWPESPLIMVGRKAEVESVFEAKPLRNSLQPLYFGLQDIVLRHISADPYYYSVSPKIFSGQRIILDEGSGYRLFLYSRCLVCNRGQPWLKLLASLPIGFEEFQQPSLFLDQMDDMYGMLMRMVAFAYFPYGDYNVDPDDPGGVVPFNDCLDKRTFDAIAEHLNFTYEIRPPWDGGVGIMTESGNWTGMAGTLQYENADMCNTLGVLPGEWDVMEYMSTVLADLVMIISLKPEVLPQHLAILRPFSVTVWICILLSIIAWGAALWFLLKIESVFVTGDTQGKSLSEAMFFSWAVILEDPPVKPLAGNLSRIMVATWLVTCFILSTGFKSSFIAHLSVQGKMPPIDSFQDLAERENMYWSIEDKLLVGAIIPFFEQSPKAAVRHVNEYLEVDELHEGLRKTLKGGHAFINTLSRITYITDSYYTNEFGESPFHFSKDVHTILVMFSWGFRKGAPFCSRISQVMFQLNDAGLLEYWMLDAMASRARQAREEKKQIQTADEEDLVLQVLQEKDDSEQVILRLSHVAGAFLTLLLGFGIATVALIGETIISEAS